MVRPPYNRIPGSRTRDEACIYYIGRQLSQEELQEGKVVTWSSFHFRLQEVRVVKPHGESGILLLSLYKSTDSSIIKHVILIVKKKKKKSSSVGSRQEDKIAVSHILRRRYACLNDGLTSY